MNHYDILIIGGDAAGMSAASQARRANNDISIGVFEKTGYVSYAACGMPYFIDNIVADKNKLLAIDKEKFINERNIHINTNFTVEKINFEKKEVTIKHEDRTGTYSYNKLVIATGARAIKPPIKGIESSNIFVLRNLDEGIAIKKYIEKSNPSKGIIIGGGSIGLEMAESFRTLGIETILLEKMDKIAVAFDDEIREIILRELKNNKVSIRTGVNITEFKQENAGIAIHFDGEKTDADFVLVSAGIRPNTEFIKDSPLKMAGGAILVNERSETNIPDVYAAGDCATVKHLITSRDVYMPLGTTANKQGRVAGLQAAGIHTEHFNGIVGSFMLKMFDLELAKTGLSETEAAKYGINAKSAVSQWKSRAGYFPGAENIFIKITINTGTHEVIGGQTAGTDGAALRLNIIAAAVTAKMKIEDFAYLDLGYAPPFSPVWDSLLVAAQNLIPRK